MVDDAAAAAEADAMLDEKDRIRNDATGTVIFVSGTYVQCNLCMWACMTGSRDQEWR